MARSIGLAALAVLLIAGCGSAPSVENPYWPEFQQAIDETDSEFVCSVLEDGVVTETEYQEALDGWLRCTADAGLKTWLEGDGRGFRAADSCEKADCRAEYDRADAIMMTCDAQYLFGVEFLYNAARRNPSNEDEYVIVRNCLVRHGVLPESTRPDDISPAFDDGTLDMGDPEVAACLRNPNDIPELE